MAEYNYRQSIELWIINSRVIASQQAYVHAYFKESWYEVKHYYCPCCGKVWGIRIVPDFMSPRHHYYQSTCSECEGDENMLTPWELEHTDILGPNVLAYLILHGAKAQENNDEILENTIQ